jgi:hypothetical protein
MGTTQIRAEELREGDRVLAHDRVWTVERTVLLDYERVLVAYGHGWTRTYERGEPVRVGGLVAR